MSKGRTRAKLDAQHPDRWTRRLVRGRVDLEPDIVPTVVVFLDMLKARYERERAKIAGRTSGLDPAHFSPLIDRFTRLIDSVSTIATDMLRPQSGVEYTAACNRVLGAESMGAPTVGTPAPGTPAFSRTEG